MRRAHVHFWFYSGTDDPLRFENRQFADELKRLHVAHRYLVLRGGHNWALWRGQATRSLLFDLPLGLRVQEERCTGGRSSRHRQDIGGFCRSVDA